jgi:hypothetical protein
VKAELAESRDRLALPPNGSPAPTMRPAGVERRQMAERRVGAQGKLPRCACDGCRRCPIAPTLKLSKKSMMETPESISAH